MGTIASRSYWSGKGTRMTERIKGLFGSAIVDTLVKIAVPALIGVSGYFFSFILETSTRLVAIESSRFTQADGRQLQDRVAEHSLQIGILESNQKRVMTTLDRVVDSQSLMLENQAEIKATLKSIVK